MFVLIISLCLATLSNAATNYFTTRYIQAKIARMNRFTAQGTPTQFTTFDGAAYTPQAKSATWYQASGACGGSKARNNDRYNINFYLKPRCDNNVEGVQIRGIQVQFLKGVSATTPARYLEISYLSGVLQVHGHTIAPLINNGKLRFWDYAGNEKSTIPYFYSVYMQQYHGIIYIYINHRQPPITSTDYSTLFEVIQFNPMNGNMVWYSIANARYDCGIAGLKFRNNPSSNDDFTLCSGDNPGDLRNSNGLVMQAFVESWRVGRVCPNNELQNMIRLQTPLTVTVSFRTCHVKYAGSAGPVTIRFIADNPSCGGGNQQHTQKFKLIPPGVGINHSYQRQFQLTNIRPLDIKEIELTALANDAVCIRNDFTLSFGTQTMTFLKKNAPNQFWLEYESPANPCTFHNCFPKVLVTRVA